MCSARLAKSACKNTPRAKVFSNSPVASAGKVFFMSILIIITLTGVSLFVWHFDFPSLCLKRNLYPQRSRHITVLGSGNCIRTWRRE